MVHLMLLASSAACPPTAGYRRLAQVPADVRAALPPMAEVGRPFQVTDVLGPRPLPARRFVRAWRAGCRLVVRFEFGGIAHGVAAMVLERRRGRWTVVGRAAGAG